MVSDELILMCPADATPCFRGCEAPPPPVARYRPGGDNTDQGGSGTTGEGGGDGLE